LATRGFITTSLLTRTRDIETQPNIAKKIYGTGRDFIKKEPGIKVEKCLATIELEEEEEEAEKILTSSSVEPTDLVVEEEETKQNCKEQKFQQKKKKKSVPFV
jgi:hypothetical protein